MATPEQASRREYMRNEGFVLVDDVFHQFMDTAVTTVSTTRLSGTSPESFAGDLSGASAGGLMLVARQLRAGINALPNPRDPTAGYGLSKDDLSNKNRFDFGQGFADVNFTWHFAPGAANAVARTFVSEDYITSEQYKNLTFGDWADIIGSAWFSDLIHDMALTSNGRYNDFGSYATHYREGGLRGFLGFQRSPSCGCETCNAAFKLFDVDSTYEESADQTYLTANVTDGFRRWLRKGMAEADSPGCPVARRAGSISLELVNNNQHARHLIERGDLEILARDEKRGRARFIQEYTPIDRALDGFAALLDGYEQAHGTPYVTSKRVKHRNFPRTNALVHQGNAPFELAASEQR